MHHSEPIFPLARYDAEGRRLRLKAVGYMERALVTYPKDPNLHRTIDSIMTGLQLTRNLPYSQPQFPSDFGSQLTLTRRLVQEHRVPVACTISGFK